MPGDLHTDEAMWRQKEYHLLQAMERERLALEKAENELHHGAPMSRAMRPMTQTDLTEWLKQMGYDVAEVRAVHFESYAGEGTVMVRIETFAKDANGAKFCVDGVALDVTHEPALWPV